jgi:ankyrin repeat protein
MSVDDSVLTECIEAAARGDLEAVRALVEAHPDLLQARRPTGERPIHAAHYSGHLEVRDFLWARGVERDIFVTSELGLLEEVRALLDADPALAHAQRPGGATALHGAVYWGHPEVARVLLDRGADPTRPTDSGFTPLHSAVAAPTPYCPGDDERTVVETVTLLLEAGAEVNARSRGGLTPLFTAAANGDLEVVCLLLERGADPSIAGYGNAGPYANQAAADIAHERGHAEVAAYLSALAS